WQRLVKAPSNRELTPTYITRLTQSITEKNRMDLLRLRAVRLSSGEYCAVDSTSRCAYGASLADIKWGKNKERLPLEQTVEVVVYALNSHMPVYYRTFPGNIPDSRTLETILVDLSHAGFKDIILITDRGYEKIRSLESYILKGQEMIMCTKVQQKHVLEKINGLGSFDSRPDAMSIDPRTRLYYKQYDLSYSAVNKGEAVKEADRLRLNLYFDSVRRSSELLQLDIDISKQQVTLAKLADSKAAIDDETALGRECCYFTVTLDKTSGAIQHYAVNEKKVAKAHKVSGFFSITTHKIDLTAMEVFEAYRLRDEQEKYFEQMKDQMVADRQRNWSEEGKIGRLFIMFVSLVISSYVRHIWRSTELYEHFTSSLEVLDEMRSIRCVEHTNKTKLITPFVGDQTGICRAFDIEVPEGCSPDYVSKQTFSHRRGRPRKYKTIEHDL
ncbi:MAG: transposase, partial [Synergistaceae bacterium]|nr:transposase [Synergistaceae bacterium]